MNTGQLIIWSTLTIQILEEYVIQIPTVAESEQPRFDFFIYHMKIQWLLAAYCPSNVLCTMLSLLKTFF